MHADLHGSALRAFGVFLELLRRIKHRGSGEKVQKRRVKGYFWIVIASVHRMYLYVRARASGRASGRAAVYAPLENDDDDDDNDYTRTTTTTLDRVLLSIDFLKTRVRAETTVNLAGKRNRKKNSRYRSRVIAGGGVGGREKAERVRALL